MPIAQNKIDSVDESFIHFPSRFENPRLIAKGANSGVYAATDSVLDRMVAIKVLFADSQHKPAGLEKRLLASLNHPGIIRLLDVCHSDDASHLILHYCHKGSMDQERSSLELSYPRKIVAIETLVQAVRYLHNQGWMHCDIKPANILLDDRDRFFLSDFGDARPIQEQGKAPAMVGSVGYMAPELLSSKSGPSVASEVYSIGVAIYELLSGSRAFSSDPVVAMQEATSKGIPRLARSIPSAKDWNSIIQKACNLKVTSRYTNLQELANDVQCVREDKPVSARRMGVLEQLTRFARREPITTGLVSAVFLVILVGAIASGLAWVEASNQLARSKSNQHKLERLSEEAIQAKKNLDLSLVAANTESEKAKKLEAETEAAILSASSLREKLQNESTAAEKLNLELATTVADLEKSLALQKESERKLTEIVDKVEVKKNTALEIEYWKLMLEARKLLIPESYSQAIELMNKSNPSLRRLEYYLMQGLAQNQWRFPERTEVGTIEFGTNDELTKYESVSSDGRFYVRCSRKEVKLLSLKNGILSSLQLPNFKGVVENIGLRFNSGENKLVLVRAAATSCDAIILSIASDETWTIENISNPIEGNCIGLTGFNGDRVCLACKGLESGTEETKFWSTINDEKNKFMQLVPISSLPAMELGNGWSYFARDKIAATGGEVNTKVDRINLEFTVRFRENSLLKARYANIRFESMANKLMYKIVLSQQTSELGPLEGISIPLAIAPKEETLLGLTKDLEVFTLSYGPSVKSNGKYLEAVQLPKVTVFRYNFGCQHVRGLLNFVEP